jgi:hypothetical protein
MPPVLLLYVLSLPPARPAWLQRALCFCQAVLDHPVVNLPLGATIVGSACAAIGPVRGLLVNELAALHWVWLSLSWVGAAAAPLATMQIGMCCMAVPWPVQTSGVCMLWISSSTSAAGPAGVSMYGLECGGIVPRFEVNCFTIASQLAHQRAWVGWEPLPWCQDMYGVNSSVHERRRLIASLLLV